MGAARAEVESPALTFALEDVANIFSPDALASSALDDRGEVAARNPATQTRVVGRLRTGRLQALQASPSPARERTSGSSAHGDGTADKKKKEKPKSAVALVREEQRLERLRQRKERRERALREREEPARAEQEQVAPVSLNGIIGAKSAEGGGATKVKRHRSASAGRGRKASKQGHPRSLRRPLSRTHQPAASLPNLGDGLCITGISHKE